MESAATRRNFLASGAAVAIPLSARSAGNNPTAAPRAGLLAGKRAVIYGAAGAMGSAVARAYAREGAQVFLAGRTLERVQSLAEELTRSGASATAAGFDALDRAAVEKHLDEVVGSAGGVDISFNLIGLGGDQGQPLTSMTQAGFAVAIDNAMRTHFLTATAAARRMKAGGVILALTAQVARKPYVGSGGFGVACAAIEALWRQLAIELGPGGIRLVTLRSSGSPDAPGVAAAITNTIHTVLSFATPATTATAMMNPASTRNRGPTTGTAGSYGCCSSCDSSAASASSDSSSASAVGSSVVAD